MYTYISYKPYAIAYIVSGSRRVAQYEAADLLCTTDKHIYLYNISYNIYAFIPMDLPFDTNILTVYLHAEYFVCTFKADRQKNMLFYWILNETIFKVYKIIIFMIKT